VPLAFHQAFSSQIFANLKSSSFFQTMQIPEAWCAASIGAAPLMMRRGAAPVRAGGNDRQFLFSDSSLISFCFLTIIPVSG
jgi:hypothetical protein